VIGEGIETTEAIVILREMGCDIGQGNFWSKELAEDEFIEFLKNYKVTFKPDVAQHIVIF
jgi:EAL domain-containing protein (putative c-di-GMP-specific phosphodiesterase class I)